MYLLLYFNYFLIVVFIVLCVCVLFLLVNFLVGFFNYYTEKISSYECGFVPFNNARNVFDIRFYLVGILFLLFDIEVLFLFPAILTFFSLNWFGFFVCVIFIAFIFLSFYYEYIKGVLDWS